MTTNITWPSTLPQKILASNANIKQIDQVIRTQTDDGHIKTQRRSTIKRWTINGSIYLDSTQIETFRNFFNETLKGGALQFKWSDPIGGSTADFLFLSVPVINYESGVYRVSMSLLMTELA